MYLVNSSFIIVYLSVLGIIVSLAFWIFSLKINLSFVIFLSFVVIISVYLIYNKFFLTKKIDLLDIIHYYTACYFLSYFFRFFIQNLFPEARFPYFSQDVNLYSKAFLFLTIGYIFFVLGVVGGKKIKFFSLAKRKEYNYQLTVNTLRLLMLISLLILLIFFIIIKNKFTHPFVFIREKNEALYGLGPLNEFNSILKYSLFTYFLIVKRLSIFDYIILIGIIFYGIILNTQKAFFIPLILAPFLRKIKRKNFYISTIKAIYFGLGLIFIITIGAYLRDLYIKLFFNLPYKFKLRDYLILLSSTFPNLDLLIRCIELNKIISYPFKGVIDSILSFIPRIFWNTKPLLYGQQLYQVIIFPNFLNYNNYNFARYGTSFLGEALLEMGIIGVFIYPFIAGIISGAIWRLRFYITKDRNWLTQTLVIFYVMYAYNIDRSGLDGITCFIIDFFIFYLTFYFLEKIVRILLIKI